MTLGRRWRPSALTRHAIDPGNGVASASHSENDMDLNHNFPIWVVTVPGQTCVFYDEITAEDYAVLFENSAVQRMDVINGWRAAEMICERRLALGLPVD